MRTIDRKRDKSLDEFEESKISKTSDSLGAAIYVEKKAFKVRIARTVVSFEWSIVTNSPSFAILQISEMPSGNSYPEICKAFLELIQDIIPMSDFSEFDLSKIVANIHDAEENNTSPETRSHRYDYLAPSGGKLSGSSSGTTAGVCNDPGIAPLIKAGRNLGGGGVFANVYFLADDQYLLSDLHVYVYVNDANIRIARHCVEEEERHVVSRLRHFAV